MNNITKRNRLLEELDRYAAFMNVCPVESKLRLAFEINRIAQALERIKMMGLAELQTQIEVYTDVRESKMNYMGIEVEFYAKKTALNERI